MGSRRAGGVEEGRRDLDSEVWNQLFTNDQTGDGGQGWAGDWGDVASGKRHCRQMLRVGEERRSDGGLYGAYCSMERGGRWIMRAMTRRGGGRKDSGYAQVCRYRLSGCRGGWPRLFMVRCGDVTLSSQPRTVSLGARRT